MRQIAVVTDDDLVRSRTDAAFRHRLIAENLEWLLTELNRLRAVGADPQCARQIRDGVALAVKLAEILQRIEQTPHARADSTS